MLVSVKAANIAFVSFNIPLMRFFLVLCNLSSSMLADMKEVTFLVAKLFGEFHKKFLISLLCFNCFGG